MTAATGLAFSEPELVRSICLESFYDFLKEFWHVIVPEDPVWNWHIELMAEELQMLAERVFAGQPKKHDLIINVPPGSTKSLTGSIMFPAWTMARMPTVRHICGSHTYELVLDLSRKSRDVVASELYQACFPEIQLRDDQNTKGYWANTQGGSRFSCTVGGKTPTGFHGHFIIIDDPLDPHSAMSEADLAVANRWMRETLPSRKVDKAITPTILIMQRLHQNDPTGAWLTRGGKVKHICLPAESSFPVKPKRYRKRYVDGLLDPVRLSREVLREAREDLGEYGFSGQFGQQPIPLGGAMFKTDRLLVDVPPKHFRQVVRYWDKAATKDAGAFTVGVKMGLDHLKRYWVLDVVRGQWSSDEREAIIRKTAEIDGKSVVIGLEQEPGSGGKESAQATVRNLAGFKVRVYVVGRSEGNKINRADPFSTQVNQGNVLLRQGAPWLEQYVEELRFFPRSQYKDQVDASSGAFNMLAVVRKKVGALGF